VIACRIWFCVVALVVAAAPAFAQTPQSAAGRIKVASGSVFIVRAGAQVPAQAGQLVFEADSLRTGADGHPYGTRIPFIAVGPMVKKNFVSHAQLEHSSVVKFIEWNWLSGQTTEPLCRSAGPAGKRSTMV